MDGYSIAIRKINKKYEEKTWNMYQEYSYISIMECETFKDYKIVLDYAIENRKDRIVDIGCAYAIQAAIFAESGIEYHGVDRCLEKEHLVVLPEHECLISFEENRYPAKEIPSQKLNNAVGVAFLSLCYFETDQREEQVEALYRDFKTVFLHVPKECESILQKYFTIQKMGSMNHIWKCERRTNHG